MDSALQQYLESTAPDHRELFLRLHRLVVGAVPDANVGISYTIPTYRLGRRRVHLGIWQHGVSIYGWGGDRDGGFAARHPDLLSGRATIRLRPDDAAGIPDDEFSALFSAALNP